ncbi:hypothetical protein CBL_13956 [Carabus blaptoides fortunei]
MFKFAIISKYTFMSSTTFEVSHSQCVAYYSQHASNLNKSTTLDVGQPPIRVALFVCRLTLCSSPGHCHKVPQDLLLSSMGIVMVSLLRLRPAPPSSFSDGT